MFCGHGLQIRAIGSTDYKSALSGFVGTDCKSALSGDLVERQFNEYGSGTPLTPFQTGINDMEWDQKSKEFTETPYSTEDFQYFIDNFKQNSSANQDGKYNKFPLQRENQLINLYQEFHPIQ